VECAATALRPGRQQHPGIFFIENTKKFLFMPELELSPAVQQWVNVVLIWVGFGTLSGLLATLVLPVRQPSHPLAALLLGALGSLLGLLGLSWIFQGRQFNPISPMGFVAATAAAILLLILYRACSACFVKKDG
jgi:uncharacterized membrane protein YeaQ/YmgE (transglycosylase-associated protein family)